MWNFIVDKFPELIAFLAIVAIGFVSIWLMFWLFEEVICHDPRDTD